MNLSRSSSSTSANSGTISFTVFASTILPSFAYAYCIEAARFFAFARLSVFCSAGFFATIFPSDRYPLPALSCRLCGRYLCASFEPCLISPRVHSEITSFRVTPSSSASLSRRSASLSLAEMSSSSSASKYSAFLISAFSVFICSISCVFCFLVSSAFNAVCDFLMISHNCVSDSFILFIPFTATFTAAKGAVIGFRYAATVHIVSSTELFFGSCIGFVSGVVVSSVSETQGIFCCCAAAFNLFCASKNLLQRITICLSSY